MTRVKANFGVTGHVVCDAGASSGLGQTADLPQCHKIKGIVAVIAGHAGRGVVP